jgi:hypothetical protein
VACHRSIIAGLPFSASPERRFATAVAAAMLCHFMDFRQRLRRALIFMAIEDRCVGLENDNLKAEYGRETSFITLAPRAPPIHERTTHNG